MGEALGCGGSSFRHQVQHGKQEAAERVGFLFGPLILFYQDIKQTPRLQLGDVPEIAWGKTHLKFNRLLNRHKQSLFAVVNHNNRPPHFSQQLDKHVPVYISKVKQVNRFSFLETTHTHNHSIKTAHKVYYLTNFNKNTFPSKALVCTEEQQTTSCLKESQPSINYAHPPAEGSAGG